MIHNLVAKIATVVQISETVCKSSIQNTTSGCTSTTERIIEVKFWGLIFQSICSDKKILKPSF